MIIREFKPDVVHFHNIGPQLSLSPLFAVKKFNIPTDQPPILEKVNGAYSKNKYTEGGLGFQIDIKMSWTPKIEMEMSVFGASFGFKYDSRLLEAK